VIRGSKLDQKFYLDTLSKLENGVDVVLCTVEVATGESASCRNQKLSYAEDGTVFGSTADSKLDFLCINYSRQILSGRDYVEGLRKKASKLGGTAFLRDFGIDCVTVVSFDVIRYDDDRKKAVFKSLFCKED